MEELSDNPLIRRSQIKRMQKERRKIAKKNYGGAMPWKEMVICSAIKVFTTKDKKTSKL